MTDKKYPGRLYIPINTRDVTFAFGIYKTYEEAHNIIIDIIFKYENENIIELMKDESLKTKKEVGEFFKEKGFDGFDFLYSVDIYDVNIDEIFDFTIYSDWDLTNLYDLLTKLGKGKMTKNIRVSDSTYEDFSGIWL